MEFIKMVSGIEIDVQEDVVDLMDEMTDDQYDLVVDAYEKIMQALEGQMFSIAQNNGFSGDLEDFKSEIIKARTNK